MFYSHEVLTSRKYGVATVWLVATLGSKSALKKVSRKAILEVDVPKACDTIVTPEAPMALRLQSNLLYGVSRVYNSQCGYVLADAQAAQNNMRALLKVVRADELETDAGKARPQALLLEDDPSFLPDLAFHLPDFGLSQIDRTQPGSSQLASSLSPRRARSTPTDEQRLEKRVGGLIIPTDISGTGGIGGFSLAGDDGLATNLGLGQRGFSADDADNDFLADPLFGFDAEGNLVDIEPQAPAHGIAVTPGQRTIPGSDAASSRVRREHAEGQQQGLQGGDLMDIDLLPLGDEYAILPEGEAFPSGERLGTHTPELTHSSLTIESSEESAQAPLRQRRRGPRIIPLDESIELRNSDISAWNRNYLANMAEATRIKMLHRAPFQAKKNAEYWIVEMGIGGVGAGIGSNRVPQPLAAEFSGRSFFESLTGIKISPLGQKRNRETDGEETDDTGRRVRARRSEEQELARGAEGQDGFDMHFGDQDVELPREAVEALEDISSAMPWNITASIRGSSVLRSGAGTGPVQTAGSISGVPNSRRGSRLVSASPLLGRSRPSGAAAALGGTPLQGASLELSSVSHEAFGGGMDIPIPTLGAEEEFELYGPAAGVDTQTAAQSQWTKATLDNESYNFLAFIENGIAQKMEEDEAQEGRSHVQANVLFEELLPPQRNSRIVAAQGLLHVLSLGTKNLIRVRQEEGYGPIALRVIATASTVAT